MLHAFIKESIGQHNAGIRYLSCTFSEHVRASTRTKDGAWVTVKKVSHLGTITFRVWNYGIFATTVCPVWHMLLVALQGLYTEAWSVFEGWVDPLSIMLRVCQWVWLMFGWGHRQGSVAV